jgi:hypothetical protein
MKTHNASRGFLAIALVLSLAACSKHKGEVYSCDPVINRWATQAREVNQSISRDSLATFGLDSQKAIFRSLTSDNKYRIYREKLALILADNSLSQTEKAYVQSGYDFFKPEYYDHPEDSTVVDSFYVSWANRGVATFGWSRKQVFFFAETWVTEPEFEGMIGIPSTSAKNDCTCLSDWYCGSWAGHSCDKGDCDVTRGGCGWLGGSDCKGKCDWQKSSGSGAGGNAPM